MNKKKTTFRLDLCVGNKYKCTNFLTNGDLVTCKDIKIDEFNQKLVISVYSLNNSNNWICSSKYELNEKKIMSGEVINDKLWILSNKTIFILNLITFKYRRITLEINVSVNRIILVSRIKFLIGF